ncbi:unnamed protein product [Amoebophrya sp. A25]|nr:unnamed protein product [Amoebophrya sp. A25]|eukprot:GSA25T00010851001.1
MLLIYSTCLIFARRVLAMHGREGSLDGGRIFSADELPLRRPHPTGVVVFTPGVSTEAGMMGHSRFSESTAVEQNSDSIACPPESGGSVGSSGAAGGCGAKATARTSIGSQSSASAQQELQAATTGASSPPSPTSLISQSTTSSHSLGDGGFSPGAMTSFLELSPSAGKLSLSQMGNIAFSVASSAASHTASGRANAECKRCRPNFSVCPENWEHRQDQKCYPPAGYSGYCGPFSLTERDDVEKEEAEVFCRMCFPCATRR